MASKLTDTIRQFGNRTWLASRVTALTGGLSAVDGVVVTAAGTGYLTPPTVSFSGGGGSAATATAVLAGATVRSVTMTNPGSGYTSTPTVGFASGSGSGAAGTAIMLGTTLDAIRTTNISLTGNPIFVEFMVSGHANLYRLRAGTDPEASPFIIRPDDYAGTTNEKVWELIGMNPSKITKPIKTLAYAATVNIDFDGPDVQVIGTLTGNLSLTTSNRGAGKRALVKFTSDASIRNTVYEAWTVVGAALPATLAATKTAELDLMCYGSTVGDVVAKQLTQL